MINITANVSPLIPLQFPEVYQEQGPVFVQFVQAYFQWLEETNNPIYYARNLYNIHDIDATLQEFIVFFKDKYLINIPFTTESDIRLVIKHALDIYRSKGTERCTTLLFQLAFNEKPAFYYPSTDLFKLSDGQWLQPNYLELSPGQGLRAQLQNKEIKGIFSEATAFVDDIIRRNNVMGMVEDIAFISAITGTFQVGEKVQPTDGSIPITLCPTILGSLDEIVFSSTGSGENYAVGDSIQVASQYGVEGQFLVTNTIDIAGFLSLDFIGGGWGYQINQPWVTISYSNASANIANGSDIWTYYGNGNVMGIGYVSNSAPSNATAGVLTVMLLTGNLDNTFYTYSNAISAKVNTYSAFLLNPTDVWVSNVELSLSNVVMNTSNLEFVHLFNFFDAVTQPLATINYISANGTFTNGENIFTYFSNGSVMGEGYIVGVNQTNSTSGNLFVNILSGNVDNTFYTTSNAVTANINQYTNSTATGFFIANSDSMILNITNVNGQFINGEVVYQIIPLPEPESDQKVEGWATVVIANSTALQVNGVVGVFPQDGYIQGNLSGATANVSSSTIFIGLVNVNGTFVIAPYVSSPLTTATIDQVTVTESGFSVQIANSLLSTQNTQVNIDLLSTYANVELAATTYGFPAFPVANSSTGLIANCMNMANATIGSLANVFISGEASLTETPYIVIDFPLVSQQGIGADVLQIEGGNYVVGEIIQQAATGVQGNVVIVSNSGTVIIVNRYNFTNDFVVTTNSTTTITGLTTGIMANITQVDYSTFANPMGRNANVVLELSVGNNAILSGVVTVSGYGFSNGESVNVGSNGAVGTIITGGIGTGNGSYLIKGGFLSDQKKLFDGYFYQHFSYEIISSIIEERYSQMIDDITHPAGMIRFSDFVYSTQDNHSLNINNSVIKIGKQSSEYLDMGVKAGFSGSYIWEHANGAANTSGSL